MRNRINKLTVLIGLVIVLIVVASVGVVAAVTGDDKSSHPKADKDDPFPENKEFHTGADANPYAGAVPLKTQFKAKPFHAKGDVKYYWRFDDGTTSREQNPVHTFTEAGYYTVLMDARDASGRRDRFTLILGGWPKGLWGTSEKRRLTKNEQLNAVRDQGRRTKARRARLKREGKPVNDLDQPANPAAGAAGPSN
jgi:PKD domain-containing protein